MGQSLHSVVVTEYFKGLADYLNFIRDNEGLMNSISSPHIPYQEVQHQSFLYKGK